MTLRILPFDIAECRSDTANWSGSLSVLTWPSDAPEWCDRRISAIRSSLLCAVTVPFCGLCWQSTLWNVERWSCLVNMQQIDQAHHKLLPILLINHDVHHNPLRRNSQSYAANASKFGVPEPCFYMLGKPPVELNDRRVHSANKAECANFRTPKSEATALDFFFKNRN